MRTLIENGQTFVILPLQEYEHICEKNEERSDIAAFDAAMARGEESFPMALLDEIEAGKNALMAFREYRRMTQQTLAKAAGISVPYLCQMEKRVRKGSIESLKAIAAALDVPMDLLA